MKPGSVHVSLPFYGCSRRHRLPLPAFATALVASLALAAPSAQAANCPGADQLPLLSTAASAKSATLCLINASAPSTTCRRCAASRRSRPPPRPTPSRWSSAVLRARQPERPDDQRSPRLLHDGHQSYTIGENLAWGQSVLGTPVSIVNAWMRSQGHRDNILNANFEEIGVGIVPGSPRGGLLNAGATYATEFGFRELGGRASPTQASAASLTVGVDVRRPRRPGSSGSSPPRTSAASPSSATASRAARRPPPRPAAPATAAA